MATDVTSRAVGTGRIRAGVVATATVVALVSWILLRLGGVDLMVHWGDATRAVDGVSAVLSAAASGLMGWGFLAVLERRLDKAKALRIWTIVATATLALSLPSPLSQGVDWSDRLGLVHLHLAVGLALILGFRRISRLS